MDGVEERGLDYDLRPEDTEDLTTGNPIPYHNLFDDGDAQLMQVAESAGNTMMVHFQLGATISTGPGVPRFLRLRVPRLCTVAFAKRAVCRLLSKNLYPSFLQLLDMETGRIIEDCAPLDPSDQNTHLARGAEATLARYGVGHDSVLRLEIREGDIFEALRVQAQPRGVPLAMQVNRRHREQAAANGVAGPPAAQATGVQGGEGGPAAADQDVADQEAPRQRAQKRQQARVTFSEGTGDEAAAASPGGQDQAGRARRRYRRFSKAQTIALLDGMLKYENKSWAAIRDDPAYPVLSGLTAVQLKDRWKVLCNCEATNFENAKRAGVEDTKLQDMIRTLVVLLDKES